MTIANIDGTLIAFSSGVSTTLKIISDELKGPLTKLDNNTLKSYHNRDVFVYKAFLDPDDYSIIGAPTLVFKGIIASASIKDDPSKNITVQWKLTSHWGDFAQVNGRPTSDAIHRAIDENGLGQPDVALKANYASDLGFTHADITLSTMSTYKYMERVPRIVSKRTGLFKLRRKYTQEWVNEEWTQKFQKYTSDYASKLQTYASDIQNESLRFDKDIQKEAQAHAAAINEVAAEIQIDTTEYNWMSQRYAALKGQYDQAFGLMAPRESEKN